MAISLLTLQPPRELVDTERCHSGEGVGRMPKAKRCLRQKLDCVLMKGVLDQTYCLIMPEEWERELPATRCPAQGKEPSTHCHGGCQPLRSSSYPPQCAHKEVGVTECSHKHKWRQQMHFGVGNGDHLKPQAIGEESKPEETQEEKEAWRGTAKENNFIIVKKREGRPTDKREGR